MIINQIDNDSFYVVLDNVLYVFKNFNGDLKYKTTHAKGDVEDKLVSRIIILEPNDSHWKAI